MRHQHSPLHLAYSLPPSFRSRDFSWLGDLLEGDFAANAMRTLLSGEPDQSLLAGPLVRACKQVGYNTLCSFYSAAF